MTIQRIACCFVLAVMASAAGCKKYMQAPEVGKPAYLRIFNDIPYSLDGTSAGQPLPFLTFLLDPKMDEKGVPGGGEIVGDFLATRQLYSLSYPINAGNVSQRVNYDYPGRLPVLTAPPINGLDLSAWAQVPSGRHRVMFVTRPFTDTPFANLPVKARQKILIDTTIDLQAGEVYTMETVATDLDKARYGLYLRKESFVHEKFDDDKIYISFYNLSGAPRASAVYYGSASQSLYCRDTINVSYTYRMIDEIRSVPMYGVYFYPPMFPRIDVPISPLTKRFAASAPFDVLPVLDRSYFFDYLGQLRTYSPLAGPPAGGSYMGTFPFVDFSFTDAVGQPIRKLTNGDALYMGDKVLYFTLHCIGDPGRINTYDGDMVSDNGVEAYPALASLNLITNINGKVDISPTINIVELVYGRAYHMQIQKLYPSPYKNQ